jgi:hypothetical protein
LLTDHFLPIYQRKFNQLAKDKLGNKITNPRYREQPSRDPAARSLVEWAMICVNPDIWPLRAAASDAIARRPHAARPVAKLWQRFRALLAIAGMTRLRD